MSAAIDLHALANLHGFGKAKEILKSTGHWDAHAADGDVRRKCLVYLTAEFSASTTVEVTARSTAEAKELAQAMARDLTPREWDMDLNHACAETVLNIDMGPSDA